MSRAFKASLLFLSLLVCGSALVVTHHFQQARPAPAPRELFAIVNQQLLALRAADFSRAYHQAATGVQQKFTLTQFETMVRREYPELTRDHRVEFGVVKTSDSNALVQVFFIGPRGGTRSFIYSLIYEDEAWKIESVEEVPGFLRREPLAGTHA